MGRPRRPKEPIQLVFNQESINWHCHRSGFACDTIDSERNSRGAGRYLARPRPRRRDGADQLLGVLPWACIRPLSHRRHQRDERTPKYLDNIESVVHTLERALPGRLFQGSHACWAVL